jgi:predicted HTH domain antitoxin
MEKELKDRKKPLVSCDKYDEEDRKALYGEQKES